MSPMSQPPPEELTREQLLAAIDSEISHFQASNTATGRTRWALTLSLSALLWLGIQLWDTGVFSTKNVVLLAILLTLLWDFALKFGSALDSSLLPRQPLPGRFFAVSRLLGALRSTILFDVLKRAAILGGLFWLGSSELALLKWCSLFGLVGVLLVFTVSFMELPPTPVAGAPTPFRWVIRGVQWSAWLVQIIVTASAVFVLSQSAARFTAADVRLGVLITAFGYLLTLLVEEQFPARHLAALRTIRQNLAFGRQSLAEVKNQTDLLLLAGGSVTGAVQHTLDNIFSIAEQVRAKYTQVEGLLPNYHKLADELAQLPVSGEAGQVKREEYDRLHQLLAQLFGQANAQHDELLKGVKKFTGHVEFITFISASAAKEAQPLVEKLKVVLAPIAQQREKLRQILSPDRLSADASACQPRGGGVPMAH